MPCAAASDRNHKDIICDANAAGASLVVADRPTGDRNNSPMITITKLPTSHNGLASTLVPLIRPGPIMNTYDNPASIRPNENLRGVDGARSPSRVHTATNTGASSTIASGLIDWNHSGG